MFDIAACCAWVPAPDSETTVAKIKARLAEVIPRYMIPQHWIPFDRLPKNANGKIHRPALRDEFAEQFGTESNRTTAEAV